MVLAVLHCLSIQPRSRKRRSLTALDSDPSVASLKLDLAHQHLVVSVSLMRVCCKGGQKTNMTSRAAVPLDFETPAPPGGCIPCFPRAFPVPVLRQAASSSPPAPARSSRRTSCPSGERQSPGPNRWRGKLKGFCASCLYLLIKYFKIIIELNENYLYLNKLI